MNHIRKILNEICYREEYQDYLDLKLLDINVDVIQKFLEDKMSNNSNQMSEYQAFENAISSIESYIHTDKLKQNILEKEKEVMSFDEWIKDNEY